MELQPAETTILVQGASVTGVDNTPTTGKAITYGGIGEKHRSLFSLFLAFARPGPGLAQA